jgi:tight adherence protein B
MGSIAALWSEHGLLLMGGLAIIAMMGTWILRNFTSVKQDKRMDRVLGNRGQTVILEKDPLLATDADKVESLLSKILPSVKATQRRLSRSGIKVTTRVYLFFILFLAATLSVFVQLPFVPRGAQPLVYLALVHAVIDQVILRMLRARYQARIVKQMPEMLDHVVRSVVVGQSLEAAIKEAALAIEAPLGSEMQMIQRLTDFGIALPEAMNVTASEIDLAEFDFFVAACNVQLESGGNLAEVLRSLSELIRGREQMIAKIGAMSAEGKMSVMVLSFLPVGIFIYLWFTRRDYLQPLFDTETGQLIGYGAIFLIVIGTAVSSYITKVRF